LGKRDLCDEFLGKMVIEIGNQHGLFFEEFSLGRRMG
jgi:hypothetical protein